MVAGEALKSGRGPKFMGAQTVRCNLLLGIWKEPNNRGRPPDY